MKEKRKNFLPKIWQLEIVKYIACFVVFMVPLYFNNSHWYPFGMTKISLAIGSISLMLFFYTLFIRKNKNFSFKINKIHIAIAVFLFILTLSSILGVNPRHSFFGYFAFPTNLIFIYFISIFGILIGELVKIDKSFFKKIILVSFISSIIVAFFSYTGNTIYKLFVDFSGTIGNSSYAGAYLLFNIFFGIGLFFYYKKIWQKVLTAISVIFISLCPLFFNIDIFKGNVSFSEIFQSPLVLLGVANGATVGIIISLLFFGLFVLIFSKNKKLQISGVVSLVVALSFIFVLSLSITDKSSKINQIYTQEKTENRFVAWEMAALNFQQNPLLGNGFDNFGKVFYRYFDRSYFPESTEYLSKPHNIVWEYLSNNGLLGLVSYLSLLFILFYVLFKFKKDIETEVDEYKIFRLVFIAILFGYFIQNLFVFDTVTTYLMFCFILGLAILFDREVFSIKINESKKKFFVTFLLIFSAFSFIAFAVLPWRESLAWKKLNLNKSLTEFKNIRDGLQSTSLFGGVEDNAYVSNKTFNFYLSNIEKLDDNTRPLFLDEINSIIFELEKDIKKEPESYLSRLTIAKLITYRMYITGYVDPKIWDYAYSNLEKASELSPGNPNVDIMFSQLYVYKKDYKNARLWARRAVVKAPKYKDAYKIAEKVQSLEPNKDFEIFLNKMKEVWF